MIHYRLRCEAGHEFESWFSSGEGFDRQAQAGMVECPACGDTRVSRALMTPAVAKVPGVKGRAEAVSAQPPAVVPEASVPMQAGSKMAAGPIPAQLVAMLQKVRAEVEKNCDYVGEDFAEEARRIHHGEAEMRGIYGEATEAETEALRDEGIEVGRIPWLPRADG
jgi:hypothetical protein